MTQPSGYRGPLDHGRDPTQVMSDGAAQNLIVALMDLHEALDRRLDHEVDLAAMGPANPDSGYVTGSGEQDRMDGAITAVRQAKAERARTLKNAQQELRRAVEWYERQLGMRPPRRPRVESIDYRNGDGQRRVG